MQALAFGTTTHNPAAAVQQTSDADLIERIATGDRAAMQVIYARHRVRVYRFVLRLVANHAVAEDLVSDVFLEVWRNADRFQGRSAVTTWLLAIARFRALTALRRTTHQELDDDLADSMEDPSDNPEMATQKQDRSEILRECLSELSANHREIIDLVYYHQKSIEEVAEIVGAPVNTVKTRMFYAREKLGKLLKAKGVDRDCLA
jgi:RNA polymerase sigma-70 factor (ECF subfamily)